MSSHLAVGCWLSGRRFLELLVVSLLLSFYMVLAGDQNLWLHLSKNVCNCCNYNCNYCNCNYCGDFYSCSKCNYNYNNNYCYCCCCCCRCYHHYLPLPLRHTPAAAALCAPKEDSPELLHQRCAEGGAIFRARHRHNMAPHISGPRLAAYAYGSPPDPQKMIA